MRDDRCCNQLRVRMLQASSGIGAVILENGDMRDARVEAQGVVPRLVDPQQISDVNIRHAGDGMRVVGRIDDHVMNAETAHAAPGTMNSTDGLHLWR